jgi:hypothetical protein
MPDTSGGRVMIVCPTALQATDDYQFVKFGHHG